MAASAKPTQWVYWRCPHCGTSLVGNHAQMGKPFVCAACKGSTTVGGVPQRPKTTIQPPPGADAVFAALKVGAPLPPRVESSNQDAADAIIRNDPESAGRRAAALAQAEALRPVHARTVEAAAPNVALEQNATAARSTTRPRARRNVAGGSGGGRHSRGGSAGRPMVATILFTAAVCLLVGGAVTWYLLAGRSTDANHAAGSASAGNGNSPGAASTAAGTGPTPLPHSELAEVARPNSALAAPLPANRPKAPEPVVSKGPLSPEDVYAAAEKSVVVISRYEPGHDKPTAFGSGFFLAGADVIVTNAHVIEGADLLEIKTRDGFTGKLDRYITFDRARDIALLPIPIGLEGHKGLPLAADLPRIGEKVFAIGAPQGLDWTFTSGLVSQIRKNVHDYHTLIQTDASLSPGNSGGPLLNAHAEVVGVTTLASRAIADANNLNFAVAATEIRDANEHRGEGHELPGRNVKP